MLYNYTVSTPEGERKTGTIDAASLEIAVNSLQRRNFIIVSIKPEEEKGGLFSKRIKFFERVKLRDVVILSRQLSTLFEAKIPTLDSFKLLATETGNPTLSAVLGDIVEDVQSGISISQALAKHPKVFSKFYVNMVRSGEESGKLDEAFSYLADYMERTHDLVSKVKGALTYPAFILVAFVIVISLMMTLVVPRLTAILVESGQDIPFYTKMVIGMSDFLRTFGIFILLAIVAGAVSLWRYAKTENGEMFVSRMQLSIPYVGDLYRKFYLSRITDNMHTLFSGGISAVSALEFTSEVVGNGVYKEILLEAIKGVRDGSAISEIFSKYEDIPSLVSQMIRIGEESGKLDYILETLARFYRKEVYNSVDTLINMIEPLLVMFLGLTVGLLFVAILSPIYQIGANI